MPRDVLLTPEIRNLVSPVGVVILRAFLGSSRSLNLRNIFWHGFCFPNTEDLPHFDGASSSCSSSTSPVLVLDFGFFLISCLCSIGQHLRFPGPRQPPRYNRHNLKALEVKCNSPASTSASSSSASSSPSSSSPVYFLLICAHYASFQLLIHLFPGFLL